MIVPTRRRCLMTGAGALALPFLTPRAGRAQMRNVVDTLAADGRFDRFLELIGRAGMTDQLRGAGPFTIFAPTNQAFNFANAARLDDLLNQGTGGGGSGTGGGGTAGGASPDPVRLPAFVRYFIIPGRALTLGQLAQLGEAQLPTLNGAPLLVRATAGQPVTVANPSPVGASGGFGAGGLNIVPPAPVVQADLPATNGIIHALGAVVFP
jgi:uncharacterized surface protein with fasciclin (FAS1) repeats